MKKGFTLAELMIVLVVVGVLSAIIMPIAFQSAPDETALKFRKGYNTLGQAVRELVTSDRYYQEGDLGIMANGNAVSSATFFCETLADVINTKSVTCSSANNYSSSHTDQGWSSSSFRGNPDSYCKNTASTVKSEIIGNDDIVWYQASPATHFAYKMSNGTRLFGEQKDSGGADRIYKVICMDIDGIGVGEDPFSFGIRADGKMMLGARAQTWMEKSVQKGDN